MHLLIKGCWNVRVGMGVALKRGALCWNGQTQSLSLSLGLGLGLHLSLRLHLSLCLDLALDLNRRYGGLKRGYDFK